jgi:phenylpropionate dioxygenase-like ring-hydroxylating dioxygenase large terminal subunit
VTYEHLEKQKLHRTSYVCVDYTDTIMRRYVTTRNGRRFEVVWPDASRKWRAVI